MRGCHDSRKNSTAPGSRKSQLCHSSQRAISRRSIAGAFLQTPGHTANPNAALRGDSRSKVARPHAGVGAGYVFRDPERTQREALPGPRASMHLLRQAACAHARRGPTESPQSIVPRYGHRHRQPQRPHGANGPHNTPGPESILWTTLRSSTCGDKRDTAAAGHCWHAWASRQSSKAFW